MLIVKSVRKAVSVLMLVALVGGVGANASEPVRVACVGDSITAGYGTPDRQRYSYPAQLSVMLGDGYCVQNFGASGNTLLKKGDYPYWKSWQYRNAQKFRPDIVIIKLGTNDTKMQNWQHKDEFESNLTELIKSFQALPSNPKVYAALPVPAFNLGDGINKERIHNEVVPMVRHAAEDLNLDIIDYHTPFLDKEKFFRDGVHPDSEGAFLLAAIACKAITGNDYNDMTSAEFLKRLKESPLPATYKLWYNYKLYDTTIDHISCKVVKPVKAAAGNPWVWRARFFGHQPQADLALLAEGYHIGYCDVANLYGAPAAVERWNKFYDFAVNKLKLNPKPALEGMSRGGLIVFNWAVANPAKVSAIYADAPVCDIKSWPGGFGKGDGWPAGWPICKTVYGLDSDEAVSNFKGNPVDNAERIAKAGIPVLILYGTEDKLVPPDENCLLFAERFRDAGGEIKLISKKCGHHPHCLKDPAPIVDFITAH